MVCVGPWPTYSSHYAGSEYAEDTFAVTVEPLNQPPVVADPIEEVVVDEDADDTAIDLAAVFDDADIPRGDSLSFAVMENTHAGLVATALEDSTLTLSYAENGHGGALITVRATDTYGEFVDDTFEVVVNPVNDAPEAVSTSLVTDEDAAVRVDLRTLASDVETADDALTFAVTATPPSSPPPRTTTARPASPTA